ncbi:EmrB/QacA subfamily drug resistance transporter [Catenuloplanes nepalensis]|uniref:EmrB/QacA subfamily drug resistance transporter n=1 Tax=Catenuloplanes nepalensis TaxID=587533 RepID=A0ABT9N2Z6_9ACTN|nr:MFS transporter [Catenuloplanes nepalensis]MDP9798070.1 EmrB/QacA subfamily drug resistance transporter [Catenuloplanes nepalensis]
MGRGRRLLVLLICCMSLLIVGLDNTIVQVALPSIRADLDASLSGLQWTVDAYTLVLASLLMLAGSTADRIGRRRVFQTGLLVFALGSLACSLAPTLEWLIAARVLQAIGGSMLNPVAMSIITNTFTDPRERAQAIGVWGAVSGLGMALGPVLGGILIDSVGWEAIFWINIPVGIAAIVLTALYVPESRADHPRRPDPAGQLLVLTFLAMLTFGIIEGPNLGWTSPFIVGAFAAAALSLAGLLIYEPRREEPLLDLRFFRSAPFSGAVLIAISGFAALAGMLFLGTLYLQEVRGLSALHAGLWMLPIAAATVIFSPIAGRLVGARGTRLPLIIAGVSMTAAGAMLAAFTATTPLPWILLPYALFGLGFGMLNTPITNTAVSGMPRAQAGLAASVASTSRQVGQSLGVAVIGAVVATGLGDATGATLAADFPAASRPGFLIVATGGLIVLLVGLATTTPRAKASAARVAAALDPVHT